MVARTLSFIIKKNDIERSGLLAGTVFDDYEERTKVKME
jgi:hypothetical protein